MPYGISIADVYGANTTAARGAGDGGMGAPKQTAPNVESMGQGLSHLSLVAWVAIVGFLVLVRVLWEMSE